MNIKSLSLLIALCTTFVTPAFAGAEQEDGYGWTNAGTDDGQKQPEPESCNEGICPDSTTIIKQVSWGEWVRDHKYKVGAVTTLGIAAIIFLATGDTQAIQNLATANAGFIRYVQLGPANKAIVDAAASSMLLKQRCVNAVAAGLAWLGGYSGLQWYFGKPSEEK